MRRRWIGVSLLWSVSCASASDPAPAQGEPAQPPAAIGETKAPPPEREDGACTLAEARYLEVRRAQNHCERDDDCAAIYPGPCPQGPYYMHIDGDHAVLEAAVTAMAEACEEADCEMPMPKGIAHCDAGRCVEGRSPPVDGPKTSCWDTRVTYMRPGRPYLASAYEHQQGITPLHAVEVAGEGTLRISWRRDCTGCALNVSEHNLGMARLMTGTPFTPEPPDPSVIRPVTSRSPPAGATEHLEFPVKPGPYFIATIGETGEVQYDIELLDAEGRAMIPTRRGVVHRRICEG